MKGHLCHARGCKAPVPPRMFMCRGHWFMVPKPLRDEVWRTYRPGQEITKDPTREYLDVTDVAIREVAKKEIAAAKKRQRASAQGLLFGQGAGDSH